MRSVVILILAMLLLSGCNTMRGLGEDLRLLGESISRAASKK
jgi:entericidin A